MLWALTILAQWVWGIVEYLNIHQYWFFWYKYIRISVRININTNVTLWSNVMLGLVCCTRTDAIKNVSRRLFWCWVIQECLLITFPHKSVLLFQTNVWPSLLLRTHPKCSKHSWFENTANQARRSFWTLIYTYIFVSHWYILYLWIICISHLYIPQTWSSEWQSSAGCFTWPIFIWKVSRLVFFFNCISEQ